jgi:hypothetical protein
MPQGKMNSAVFPAAFSWNAGPSIQYRTLWKTLAGERLHQLDRLRSRADGRGAVRLLIFGSVVEVVAV